jgi:hypothetical protein
MWLASPGHMPLLFASGTTCRHSALAPLKKIQGYGKRTIFITNTG